jgi:hypothetical protein
LPTWILLSIVLVGIAIPVRAAADPYPRRGLRRAGYATFVLTALYVTLILYVLPRII